MRGASPGPPRALVLVVALGLLLAPAAHGAAHGRAGTIVFATGETLRTIGADGRHLHRLGRGADPAYSPDGRLIAFTVGNGIQSDLMVMRSDGSHRRAVLRDRADETQPAFSADGRRLFFVRDSGGEGYGDIYSVGLDGRRLRRLTKTGGERGERNPEAAANGRYLVFDRSGEVFTMRPDGSRRRHLTQGIDPAISPNSRRVVFVRHGRLCSIGAGGGHLHVLTSFKNRFGRFTVPRHPSFSPDGRRLVFVMHRRINAGVAWHEVHRLATIPARGGQPRRLTTIQVGGDDPDWQPRPH